MKIIFKKFHCSGNDFIIIDNTNDNISMTPELCRSMCSKHFGIGADGLILLKNNKDFLEITFFNPDGSSDTLCGNGSLCAVEYNKKYIHNRTDTILASDGIHHYKVDEASNNHILFNDIRQEVIRTIHLPAKINEHTLIHDAAFFVYTGSPHLVIFTHKIDNIDVRGIGTILRHDSRINPVGCNVDFAEIVDDNTLKVRTFERGVEDETLACGTGSVATAICHHHLSKTDDNDINEITIMNQGGWHHVSYKHNPGVYTQIYLGGKPVEVFEGIYKAEND